MIYLTKEHIVLINKLTVEMHGGNFVPPSNLLNSNPLDYLLEAVNAEMFGEPLYPNISDKAAVYLYNIIANHVFSDGNKRTGLESCLLFLKLNGYQLSGSITNETLTNFILEVASGDHTLQSVQNWLKDHITKK
jgi:death-on-curing protein